MLELAAVGRGNPREHGAWLSLLIKAVEYKWATQTQINVRLPALYLYEQLAQTRQLYSIHHSMFSLNV